MRDKLNCPNCGAPITDAECPYCGSVFYDFATLDSKRPTYVRMKWNDSIITVRALMMSAAINIEPDALPAIDVEFIAVPDKDGVMIKQQKGATDGWLN